MKMRPAERTAVRGGPLRWFTLVLLLAAVVVVAPGASSPGDPDGPTTPEPLQWPSDASILPSEGAGYLLGGQPAAQYHYDARGRRFEGGGRGIAWTSFDLPRWIIQGGQTTTFRYDAFGGRVKKTRAGMGAPTTTTLIIAGI